MFLLIVHFQMFTDFVGEGVVENRYSDGKKICSNFFEAEAISCNKEYMCRISLPFRLPVCLAAPSSRSISRLPLDFLRSESPPPVPLTLLHQERLWLHNTLPKAFY